MGQIIIIKFGVTNGSYQYKGLWSPFVESNVTQPNTRTIFVYPHQKRKIQRRKNKGSLQLEDHKTNFLINLSSSSFHSIIGNPGTLLHPVFIMILSMGTQRDSTHLYQVISLHE